MRFPFALPALTLPTLAYAASVQDALLPAGVQAEHILKLWHFTLALCVLVFCAILLALLLALFRAPPASPDTPPDVSSLQAGVKSRLKRPIILAVALSALGLLAMLVADVATSRSLARLPLTDAVNIEITGHQWWWELRYNDPDPSKTFTTANELHIPVGRPVLLTLKSNDVIHSIWLPNMHGKKDLIPGRTAQLQLRADRPGQFRAQCAEFCGLQHAWMALPVTAQAPDEYAVWRHQQLQSAQSPADSQAQRGQQVFMSNSCVLCHSISGTQAGARFGPDLTHFASRPTIGAGVLPNDRARLTAWIVNPHAVKPGVNMPANQLAPEDLHALVAYLQGLK